MPAQRRKIFQFHRVRSGKGGGSTVNVHTAGHEQLQNCDFARHGCEVNCPITIERANGVQISAEISETLRQSDGLSRV